ncbi:hypothetical protein HK096_003722 [Nowakowskiella sp. JEL0078]|nr:hypothetical protein HK096_003722 [Nowakowskiella sp. JEL0078]
MRCLYLVVLAAALQSASAELIPRACSALYGQCGGTGFTGSTCCETGSVCVYSNDYYSQCLVGSSSSTSTKTTTTTTSSKTTSTSKTTTSSATAKTTTSSTTAKTTSSSTTSKASSTTSKTTTTTSTATVSASCIATSYTQISTVKSCTTFKIQGPFTIPANSVVDLTGLKSGAQVYITGTITWAFGTLDKTNDLITIGGTNINIDATGAVFDGNGPSYWDGLGGNGGVPKPKFIRLKGLSGTLKNLKVVNAPIHCFSISSSSDLILTGVSLDNDAFDVSSSTGITIQGATVANQDDCLAVNSGSNINFLTNSCSGGHGISIGSVKTGNVVSGVTVTGCTIANSDNGVRIKVYNDATSASVDTITYQDITLSSIAKYGIIIQQDYTNSGATGTPGTSGK